MHFSYIVCSLQRSGTNFFKYILRSQELGSPEEYGEAQQIETLEELSEMPHWSRTIWRHQVNSFLCRCKQLKNLPEILTDAEVIDAVFPKMKYIYLTRENILLQAISSVRAKQSGRWILRRYETRKKMESVATKPIRYSSVNISEAVSNIFKQQQCWENWFIQNNINPLRLTYENLVTDPQTIIEGVANFLRIPRWTFSEARLMETFKDGNAPTKQADLLTDDWLHRYMREIGL